MKSLFESYKEMVNGVSEAAVCPKCKKSPCECSVEEELKGDQHKLDKNKNGKLDADDFKKLRKEEQEPPFDKPYTIVKNKKDNGAQKARALAQKALKTAIIQGHEKYTSSPDKLKPKHFGMSEDFTDAEVDEMINEVLSKDATAGDWISDFMKSDAPQFKGKSKDKLKKMALAAYYAKQRNEEVQESYIPIEKPRKANVGGKPATVIGHAPSAGRQHYAVRFDDRKYPKNTHDVASHHNVEFKEEVESLSEATYVVKHDGVADDHADAAAKKLFAGKKNVNSHVSKYASSAEKHANMLKSKGFKNVRIETMNKEEVQIDEANHREFASQGKMHPDMAKHMSVGNEMDFYARGTGDKMSGKVMKNDGKEVHIKTTTNPYKEKDSSVHKFKIASKLEESSQQVKPTVDTKTYSWGKMKTIHHGNQFSIPLHPEHHEAIAKLKDEQEHQFKTEDGKHWTARRKGNEVHFQGANGGNTTKVSHASMREEKEETMLTFKEFIEEGHDYKAGRYVHKGTYGTSYDDPAGKDDEKAEKPAEKAVKRGRGRPAGSKSGARQFGAASKDGSGADYTGYKLHLPNSNK